MTENRESLGANNLTRSPHGQNEANVWTINANEILEIFFQKRKILVLAGALTVLFVIANHFLYPSYSSDAYLLMDFQPENNGLQALLGSLETGGAQTPLYIEAQQEKALLMLESSEFANKYGADLVGDPEYPRMRELLKKPQSFINQLKGWILGWIVSSKEPPKIDSLQYPIYPSKLEFGKSGILNIRFASVSKGLAVFLTNHYLDAATKTFADREEKKIGEARAYIENKINETLRNMETTDKKIVGATTRNSNLSLLAPQSAIAERLLQLKSDIQNAEFTHQQNEKVINTLKTKLANSPEEAHRESAPEKTAGGMFGVRKTIANLETENELLSIRIQTLKKGLDEVLKANLSLPKEESHLSDLKREKGLDFYVFDELYKTLLQIEVKGLSMLSRVYPLEHITIDNITITRPLTRSVLLALIASLLLSGSGIYAYSLFVPVIRTKKDVEALNVSFLGYVSRLEADYLKHQSTLGPVCNFKIDSKETVYFKQIRSRLLYFAEHSGTAQRKVISFLSYGNGVGKSFISANVAACFAQAGKRVLFIDFDIRRGSNSKNFGVNDKPGVCEFIDCGTPVERLILHSSVPNLDLIGAGNLRHETTENFSNKKFLELLDAVRDRYDFIILDTAPLAVAHEVLPIAQDSDFAILVGMSWKTKKENIVDALEEIETVRKERVHLVINGAKEHNRSLVSNYYDVRTKKRIGQSILAHT